MVLLLAQSPPFPLTAVRENLFLVPSAPLAPQRVNFGPARVRGQNPWCRSGAELAAIPGTRLTRSVGESGPARALEYQSERRMENGHPWARLVFTRSVG